MRSLIEKCCHIPFYLSNPSCSLWALYGRIYNLLSSKNILRSLWRQRGFLVLFSVFPQPANFRVGWIFWILEAKALYIGKLGLPADVIQFSWLDLFMVELMAQNTSKSISKLFLCLVFHEIKLKLVSNCFFASIKRYIKEKLSLIKE